MTHQDLKIGTRFYVEMVGMDYTFTGEIIGIDNDPKNSNYQFEIKITDRWAKDSRGQKYKCSDTFVEG